VWPNLGSDWVPIEATDWQRRYLAFACAPSRWMNGRYTATHCFPAHPLVDPEHQPRRLCLSCPVPSISPLVSPPNSPTPASTSISSSLSTLNSSSSTCSHGIGGGGGGTITTSPSTGSSSNSNSTITESRVDDYSDSDSESSEYSARVADDPRQRRGIKCLQHDNEKIVSGGWDGYVRIWSLANGSRSRSTSSSTSTSSSASASVTTRNSAGLAAAKGSTTTATTDEIVREPLECSHTFDGHAEPIVDLKFVPHSPFLFTTSSRVRIYHTSLPF
jgi:WD40 repeat protein